MEFSRPERWSWTCILYWQKIGEIDRTEVSRCKKRCTAYRPPPAANLGQLRPRLFMTLCTMSRHRRPRCPKPCNTRIEAQPRFPDACVCVAHHPCRSPAPTAPFWSAHGRRCCAGHDRQGAGWDRNGDGLPRITLILINWILGRKEWR
jgi:hypothetical protein